MVIPVGPQFDEYANQVKEKLYASGFMAEVDTDSSDTMNKKIRNAQLAQFNFILGKKNVHSVATKFADEKTSLLYSWKRNDSIINSFIFLLLQSWEKRNELVVP